MKEDLTDSGEPEQATELVLSLPFSNITISLRASKSVMISTSSVASTSSKRSEMVRTPPMYSQISAMRLGGVVDAMLNFALLDVPLSKKKYCCSYL